MKSKLKTFLAVMFSTVVLDSIWIFVVQDEFYKRELKTIGRLSEQGQWQPVVWAAVLVYILIPFGIVQFVLEKNSDSSKRSLLGTILRGALFGLVLYGVYDLTNFATLSAWSRNLVAIDWMWGITLCTVVSIVGWFV